MVKNNRSGYLFLSLLSAMLLTLAWQPFKVLPTAFLGLVPLLYLEELLRNKGVRTRMQLFLYSWLALLLWNLGTVWWIWNSSPEGAVAAFFINSLPMTVPFLLYHESNLRNGKRNLWFFAACWISMELLQFHWDFAFPWLLLGNIFSYAPVLVQWYEYTGVLGGSVWVVLVNLMIFQLLQQWTQMEPVLRRNYILNKTFLYLLAPLFASWYVLGQWNPSTNNKVDVMVVQPNIDPYSEKFGGMSAMDQLDRMMQLALARTDSQLQFILLPETAMQGGLEENNIDQEALVQKVKFYLSAYPGVTLVSGMDSYRLFNPGEPLSVTARPVRNSDQHWDAYNAALCLDDTKPTQVYHKNKLVPGVEKMPYPGIFKFLEKYAIALGGTSGSLGSDGESHVFETRHRVKVAPIICYESVFADFTASYVRKGAGLLCILTNDGWWGNTPGYRQHFDYGRLRAIETRRAIARSANTGISGFIDADGSVLSETPWWTETTQRAKVPVYAATTFYTRYGDWVAYLLLGYAGYVTLSLLMRRPQ